MFIAHAEAMSFIEAYEAVLLDVLAAAGENRTQKVINDLARARSYVADKPGALIEAIERVKDGGESLTRPVELALRSLRIGRWFHLRHTTRYALLLDEGVQHAYAVKALTDPLHEIAGGKAVTFEAGLVEYNGQYVCDGIVLNPVYLGPDIRGSLNEAYRRIKSEGRFHVSAAV